MDQYRMVIGDKRGAKEISRGTKEEIINSINSRDDSLFMFVRVSTNCGNDVGFKDIGDKQITWNF